MAEKTIKIMSVLSIVVGLSFMISPEVGHWEDEWRQENLISTYNERLEQSEVLVENGWTANDGLPENMIMTEAKVPIVASVPISDALVNETLEVQPTINVEKIRTEIVGILKIPSIDFKQTILRGATKKHLDTGASMIDENYDLGTPGNLSIAGHRNIKTYGKNFNRLGEVAIGDTLIVENGDISYSYTVNQCLRVKSDEVWVIGHDYTKTEITLLTCDYVNGETVRIVVKGILNK